ncbi:MAG: hypothetical protein HRU36_02950 [Rickettsiales bacterium]|nr:hypothetical protein [Rickettsiales bacterium]
MLTQIEEQFVEELQSDLKKSKVRCQKWEHEGIKHLLEDTATKEMEIINRFISGMDIFCEKINFLVKVMPTTFTSRETINLYEPEFLKILELDEELQGAASIIHLKCEEYASREELFLPEPFCNPIHGEL